jgi:hypothetical protein
MLKYIYCLCLIPLLCCTNRNKTEPELRAHINREIDIAPLTLAHYDGAQIQFSEIRSEYTYLTIVPFDEDCISCYLKFLEWHEKIASLNYGENYTVVFVIQGNSYSEFMTKVLDIEYVDDKFHTIMDPEGKFLEANKDIPRWIIESSVLIDSENKIKMVGAPWINEDMTKLFYEIVSKGKS